MNRPAPDTPKDAARRYVCWMAEGWSAHQVKAETEQTARLLAQAGSHSQPPDDRTDHHAELTARLHEWLRITRLLGDRSHDVYRNRLDPVFVAWREQRCALLDGPGTPPAARTDHKHAYAPSADTLLEPETADRLRLWADRHGTSTQLILRQLISRAGMDTDGRISVEPFVPHSPAHPGTAKT